MLLGAGQVTLLTTMAASSTTSSLPIWWHMHRLSSVEDIAVTMSEIILEINEDAYDIVMIFIE